MVICVVTYIFKGIDILSVPYAVGITYQSSSNYLTPCAFSMNQHNGIHLCFIFMLLNVNGLSILLYNKKEVKIICKIYYKYLSVSSYEGEKWRHCLRRKLETFLSSVFERQKQRHKYFCIYYD